MGNEKELYSWLTKGMRREKTMTSLKQPMTAKQLSRITGIRDDCCSYVLKELLRYRLVECLNPNARRSRLYWLTDKGKQYQNMVLKMRGLPVFEYDFPIIDWYLYGWICYNHRTEIIKSLTEPLQPSTIRRKVKQLNPDMKISANNVSDILRLFLKRKIIKPVKIRKKVYPKYELTDLGIKLQRLLFSVEFKS